MAKPVLQRAGFEGELLDKMLGITWVECWHPVLRQHFYDAVGDLSLISDKWGPSVGFAQIRTLRHPENYPYPDTLRIAANLHDNPDVCARAARAIAGPNGEYLYKWSPYRDQTQAYRDHIGVDFELISGHPLASLWDS
jgi:hypothetical protein